VEQIAGVNDIRLENVRTGWDAWELSGRGGKELKGGDIIAHASNGTCNIDTSLSTINWIYPSILTKFQ